MSTLTFKNYYIEPEYTNPPGVFNEDNTKAIVEIATKLQFYYTEFQRIDKELYKLYNVLRSVPVSANEYIELRTKIATLYKELKGVENAIKQTNSALYGKINETIVWGDFMDRANLTDPLEQDILYFVEHYYVNRDDLPYKTDLFKSLDSYIRAFRNDNTFKYHESMYHLFKSVPAMEYFPNVYTSDTESDGGYFGPINSNEIKRVGFNLTFMIDISAFNGNVLKLNHIPHKRVIVIPQHVVRQFLLKNDSKHLGIVFSIWKPVERDKKVKTRYKALSDYLKPILDNADHIDKHRRVLQYGNGTNAFMASHYNPLRINDGLVMSYRSTILSTRNIPEHMQVENKIQPAILFTDEQREHIASLIRSLTDAIYEVIVKQFSKYQ